MPKYKKSLKELERSLAKILTGKQQAEPRKSIAKKTSDMVSVVGTYKKIGGGDANRPGSINNIIKQLKKSNAKLKEKIKAKKDAYSGIGKTKETVRSSDKTLLEVKEENEKLRRLMEILDKHKELKDKKLGYTIPKKPRDIRSLGEIYDDNSKLQALIKRLETYERSKK